MYEASVEEDSRASRQGNSGNSREKLGRKPGNMNEIYYSMEYSR